MTEPGPTNNVPVGQHLILRIGQGALLAAAIGFILFADYPSLAVPGVVAVFFAAYIWLRVMIYMENNGFTPRRLQVSLTWALVGIDETTPEFDPRPVRVYFILLSLLFASLVLRPIAQWIFS